MGKYKAKSPRDIEGVIEYIDANKEFIMKKTKHFKDMRDALLEKTPKTLHADIEKEYQTEVRLFMSEMIAFHSGLDAETISIVLGHEDLYKKYLV